MLMKVCLAYPVVRIVVIVTVYTQAKHYRLKVRDRLLHSFHAPPIAVCIDVSAIKRHKDLQDRTASRES